MERTDPKLAQRGPHFILQPQNTVVVGSPPTVELECVVTGYPPPVYSWWKGENYQLQLTAEKDPRYTLTNGKLIISVN